MSISPKCDVAGCNKELHVFGGILLSPPDSTGRVRKFHLCSTCYQTVAEYIGQPEVKYSDSKTI